MVYGLLSVLVYSPECLRPGVVGLRGEGVSQQSFALCVVAVVQQGLVELSTSGFLGCLVQLELSAFGM